MAALESILPIGTSDASAQCSRSAWRRAPAASWKAWSAGGSVRGIFDVKGATAGRAAASSVSRSQSSCTSSTMSAATTAALTSRPSSVRYRRSCAM